MLMLPSLLEATTKEEGPSRNSIKKLNVLIVAKRDTRRPIAGQKEEEKKDKKKPKKETASPVAEEGVWMAITSNSDNGHMANNKFNDFTISEDNLFFSEEENEKNEVQRLINRLKKQLKILKYTYPYDDPDFMLNDQNFTNFSDNDNTGAVAITIKSGSEDKIEINPY
jgi:hypothetical protein